MSKKNWLRERLDEGLVILSSKKKMGFPSDPKYMGYKGFEQEAMPEGFGLYDTNQCPFTATDSL